MSNPWDEPPAADAPSEPAAGAEDDLEETSIFVVEEEEMLFEITRDTDPYGTWPTLDPASVTPVEPPSPERAAAVPDSEQERSERAVPLELPHTLSAEGSEAELELERADAGVTEGEEPLAEADSLEDLVAASPEPAQLEDEDSLAEAESVEDLLAASPQLPGLEAEMAPVESVSVEHVAGEIHVPDGYTVLEGSAVGRRRAVALVISRYNGALTDRLLARAIEALEDAGVTADAVTIVPVPGAFELPLAAMALAKTRRYSCIVALGAIVRGETPHFDLVAGEAASGLQLAGIETGVPVAFGVLAVDTVAQAEARIDRAAEAVQTALEMADMFSRLRAASRAH